MVQRKRSSKRPQPRHKKQSKSQHDKRKRLQGRNPGRKKTSKAKVPLSGVMATAVSALQAVMDRRIAFRLAIIVAGMLLADDRRTASSWFVAAGVQDDWDRFYDCLISIGRTSGNLATAVLGLVVRKFAPGLGDRILVGLDDSPTPRFGPHVEGAGVHHNPTPGPADGEWLYGHNWVTLAWLATHPLWSVIALPLRSMLYVREIDVAKLAENRQYKTFLATSHLTSGVIRVVILRFEDPSWAPYFCTDSSAEVRDILEAVAARWAIEMSQPHYDSREILYQLAA